MLKKWFSVLVILMCTIFAASSGCSESNEENNEEDISVPEESDEAEEEESSAGNEEETDVETVSTGDSSGWCAVGSSWKSTNPQTGEEVTMKITGMETVDGIPMCKAVYETNLEEEEYSKIEYMWSENGETYFWTAYDESGDVVSEMSMKDGKTKMVDEEGNVVEYSQGQ